MSRFLRAASFIGSPPSCLTSTTLIPGIRRGQGLRYLRSLRNRGWHETVDEIIKCVLVADASRQRRDERHDRVG